MTHLSFGTHFGSLEYLAADIWIMLYIMGGGKLFYARLPDPCFSLLFSDHFVSPVNDILLFLN